MAKSIICILIITLKNFVEYILASVYAFQKDKISNSKYKSIKKSGNKMVKILVKS